MVANPKEVHVPYHTLEEYFAIEGAGHARYEYWDGEIVCMGGGTEWHGVIGGNVYFTFQRTGGVLIWSAPNPSALWSLRTSHDSLPKAAPGRRGLKR